MKSFSQATYFTLSVLFDVDVHCTHIPPRLLVISCLVFGDSEVTFHGLGSLLRCRFCVWSSKESRSVEREAVSKKSFSSYAREFESSREREEREERGEGRKSPSQLGSGRAVAGARTTNEQTKMREDTERESFKVGVKDK